MLNAADKLRAQSLYENFFNWFNQPNPTDLNTTEKFDYAQRIGFEGYRIMQAARKEGCNFTRLVWHNEQKVEVKV